MSKRQQLRPFKVGQIVTNVHPKYHDGEEFEVVEIDKTKDNYWYMVKRIPDGLKFLVLHKNAFSVLISVDEYTLDDIFGPEDEWDSFFTGA